MRFEEEEVRAVALGNAWVAAITSLNFLRIFSDSGLQVIHKRYPCSISIVSAIGYFQTATE